MQTMHAQHLAQAAVASGQMPPGIPGFGPGHPAFPPSSLPPGFPPNSMASLLMQGMPHPPGFPMPPGMHPNMKEEKPSHVNHDDGLPVKIKFKKLVSIFCLFLNSVKCS